MDTPSSGFTASSLQTRATLLGRLRDWDDTASWREFYQLYRRLVYNLARRAGLDHAESEDVTQDVFKRVAETIRGFTPGPARGCFRSWLINLTRWRIADRLRERMPHTKYSAIALVPSAQHTSTLDRVPDPGGVDDAFWEKEWQHNLIDTAMARLARRVPAKKFQAFQLYVCQNWPVFRVARELGMNPASVYLVNHRLMRRLKAEVARLRSQLG